jgi:hypothetical protein
MNIKVIFSLFLLSASLLGIAQVKVYFVEGEVEYQPGVENDFVAVEAGDSLVNSGTLRVGERSRVVLFDDKGNNLLLKSPGLYPVAQVQSEMSEDNNEIAAFFSYVWKKLLKKKVKPEDENENSTGVVSRGKEFMFVTPADSSVIFTPYLDIELINGTAPFTLAMFADGSLKDELVINDASHSYEYAERLKPNTVYELIATDDKGTTSEPIFFIIYE